MLWEVEPVRGFDWLNCRMGDGYSLKYLYFPPRFRQAQPVWEGGLKLHEGEGPTRARGQLKQCGSQTLFIQNRILLN